MIDTVLMLTDGEWYASNYPRNLEEGIAQCLASYLTLKDGLAPRQTCHIIVCYESGGVKEYPCFRPNYEAMRLASLLAAEDRYLAEDEVGEVMPVDVQHALAMDNAETREHERVVDAGHHLVADLARLPDVL